METNKKVPAIRFKGFEKEWEEDKMANICNTLIDGDWIESKDQSRDGIRLLQTGNIGINKYLDKSNSSKWISEDTFSKLNCKEVFEGDILISRLPDPAGRACIVPNQNFKMITAVDCTIARVSKKCDSKYLIQFLSSEPYFKEVTNFLAGGTRQRISRSNLSNFIVPLPQITEQTQIGSFFKGLDDLIRLQEQKLEKVTNLKKAMLDKMFPKENADVPEIRFKGFTEKWEKKTLDEVFDFNIPTNTLSRASLNEKIGEIKNIHYGDILVKYDSYVNVINEKIPYITNGKIDDYKGHFLKDGDVIFADASEDEMVGKSIEIINVRNNYVVSGLHTIASRPLIKFQQYYLAYHLNSNSYHNQLIPLMQGTKVLSISKISLKMTSITFPPNEKEQQKIGRFFQNLDRLIALSQEKIKKLKNLKQALLQKMFI